MKSGVVCFDGPVLVAGGHGLGHLLDHIERSAYVCVLFALHMVYGSEAHAKSLHARNVGLIKPHKRRWA